MEPDSAKLLQICTGMVTCALEFHALRDARVMSRVTDRKYESFFEIHQGAFCVKYTPKICDCTPTFIINYIMIFETPRLRYPNFCAWNAPWEIQRIFSIKRLMPSEDEQFMISENILNDTCTSTTNSDVV